MVPPPPGDPPDQALANDVATAPGDIPVPEVQARLALQGEQFRHDNTITPLAPRPGEPVGVEATAGERLPLAAAAVFYTTDGSAPDVDAPSVPMVPAAVDWVFLAGFLTRWRAELPPQPAGTVVRYRIGGWRQDGTAPGGGPPDIWAHDGQGFWFRVPWPGGISTFAYRATPEAALLPAWAAEAVIYQIFVDRFHPGTPDGHFAPAGGRTIHGGTLPGIRQALPYLADLGVTCLWFTPIFASPSYHRYDATSFHKLDPRLGTDADLRALVADAHARGIRIVLDFVPSHASNQHPAFQAALRDAHADSFSWFTFYEWPQRYRSFLDRAPALPSFNTDDPGARAYLLDSATYWMREFGVDGYRLDHAIGPGMDFWVALRTATDAVNPEAILFGEATDTPDNLRRYRGRLHGVLDFPLARALRHVFALRDWDVGRFAGYLDAYEQFMQTGPGRFSFLDNHDMNRFLYLAGNDVNRLKLAALCQFTLAATPIIYYGTEIALSHAHAIEARGHGGDAQARADMPWDAAAWHLDVLEFYRALIRFRAAHPLLHHGPRHTIHVDAAAGVFGYVRSPNAGPVLAPGDLLVFFNLSAGSRSLILPAGSGQRLVPLFQTGPAPAGLHQDGPHAALTLPAETGVVLAVAE